MRKPIKTPRLVLRAMEATDRDQLVSIFTNDTVKQTYMVPDFESREAAELLFERICELSHREDRYVFGIYLQNTLIGLLNDAEISDKTIEMGYALHPNYYNQGYATEAMRATMDYLFGVGFEEVLAGAFEENPASLRVMQKCGMQKLDKTDLIDYRGKTHTCIYYAKRRA